MAEYRMCSRCIMDTSDPDIVFDDNGVCNHCRHYDDRIRRFTFTGEDARHKLSVIVAEIKKAGKHKKYDCLIGMSGGVDSTYLALKARELGLNPLAIHLDNGWDSEVAVNNIHQAVNHLGIDLYTHVLDWDEFKDLQLAFLKAGTAGLEVPTDHAIISVIGRVAQKNGLKYVVNGYNYRTESHLPRTWSHGQTDWRYISGIHRRFGTLPLKTYPHVNLAMLTYYQKSLRAISLLNYLDYVKQDAMRELEQCLGWRYYGGKHYESIYTRFYQGYMLPRRFGYDKRRMHFSSLICAGELSREQALEELKEDPYSSELLRADREYVIKKLGLTEQAFEDLMNLPCRNYWDYPSNGQFVNGKVYQTARRIYRGCRQLLGVPLSTED